MKAAVWSPIVLLFSLPACVLDAGGDDLANRNGEIDEDGEYDNDDCKIEGGDIGVVGLELGLGPKRVTFEDWVAKADSPGEYVGFVISVSGADSVRYIVKAGGELHADDVSSWIHPNGDTGSEAPAISNVDFCEECEDGSCDGGGGDGGEDGGDGGEDGGDGEDGGEIPPVD